MVAIDGFIGREWLLRNVGCICKRRFTNDTVMVRHMKKVAVNGDVIVLYPEARYSLCGTNAELPDSLGKLVKLLKIPVVSLIMHGHHINAPFWNLKNRKVKNMEAVLAKLVSKEEVESLDHNEINERIDVAFRYDDFASVTKISLATEEIYKVCRKQSTAVAFAKNKSNTESPTSITQG